MSPLSENRWFVLILYIRIRICITLSNHLYSCFNSEKLWGNLLLSIKTDFDSSVNTTVIPNLRFKLNRFDFSWWTNYPGVMYGFCFSHRSWRSQIISNSCDEFDLLISSRTCSLLISKITSMEVNSSEIHWNHIKLPVKWIKSIFLIN